VQAWTPREKQAVDAAIRMALSGAGEEDKFHTQDGERTFHYRRKMTIREMLDLKLPPKAVRAYKGACMVDSPNAP